MKDERSISAADAAIAFGEGRISLKELNAAADYASAAAYAAAAAASAAADRKENQQQTVDIFRKFIPIEKFNI